MKQVAQLETKVLFRDEVSFHDESTIIVTANRTAWEPPSPPFTSIDGIDLNVSTSVSIGLTLTVNEANELSRALAAAAKAIS